MHVSQAISFHHACHWHPFRELALHPISTWTFQIWSRSRRRIHRTRAGLGWAGLEGGDLSHLAVAVAVLFLVHHDVCMNPFRMIDYFLHCSLTKKYYESYEYSTSS